MEEKIYRTYDGVEIFTNAVDLANFINKMIERNGEYKLEVVKGLTAGEKMVKVTWKYEAEWN